MTTSNHMAKTHITKATAEAAVARAKDYLVWDSKLSGFGLKVTPSGSRVFVFQYRMGGRGAKVRRYTIGKFPGLTVEAARKIATELNAQKSRGIDPQAVKIAERRMASELAFAAYAEGFIDGHLKQAWKSSHADGAALLRNYAAPVLRNTALPDIDRAAIKRVLARAQGKAATARNLFAVLRLLFNHAADSGDLAVSPMLGQKAPPMPVSRDRTLNDVELELVWRCSDALEYPFGPLVRMLILTGARREEVAGLDWSELDRQNHLWTLPANRSKNGIAAIMPLSSPAIEELDKLGQRTGRDKGWPRRGLVFSTTGKTPVSGFSKAKRRLDDAVKIAGRKKGVVVEPWRLHDLRRTLATGMQRLGVRFEVVEAILNHVSGAKGGVAGIYQRYGWEPEKRAALDAWGSLIARLLDPTDESNVVPIAGAARG